MPHLVGYCGAAVALFASVLTQVPRSGSIFEFETYNRRQNSLEHMSFALKEAFPVRKLLPFTANAPFPHCNVGCWKKTYLSTHL